VGDTGDVSGVRADERLFELKAAEGSNLRALTFFGLIALAMVVGGIAMIAQGDWTGLGVIALGVGFAWWIRWTLSLRLAGTARDLILCDRGHERAIPRSDIEAFYLEERDRSRVGLVAALHSGRAVTLTPGGVGRLTLFDGDALQKTFDQLEAWLRDSSRDPIGAWSRSHQVDAPPVTTDAMVPAAASFRAAGWPQVLRRSAPEIGISIGLTAVLAVLFDPFQALLAGGIWLFGFVGRLVRRPPGSVRIEADDRGITWQDRGTHTVAWPDVEAVTMTSDRRPRLLLLDVHSRAHALPSTTGEPARQLGSQLESRRRQI
jgi:hypothetical protein